MVLILAFITLAFIRSSNEKKQTSSCCRRFFSFFELTEINQCNLVSFSISFSLKQDWTLQIKYVQLRDAGLYECQVSVHPPASIFVYLNVVGMSSFYTRFYICFFLSYSFLFFFSKEKVKSNKNLQCECENVRFFTRKRSFYNKKKIMTIISCY